MNIIVIPFLLGAFMSVKDVKEWSFGPEYIFELKRALRVYMRKEFYIGGDVTAKVKCRSKVRSQSFQNVLFCHASNINVLNITLRKFESWNETIDGRNFNTPNQKSHKIPNRLFKIKFSKRGVQNFKLKKSKAKKKEEHYDDIITDIIDQFNIDFDLSAAKYSMRNYENKIHRPYVIFNFTQYKENMTKPTSCDTTGSITYIPSDYFNKGRKFPVKKNEMKHDFRLKLLPISYTHPASKIFSIERNRKICTHSPQYLTIFNEKWTIRNKLRQYFNKMKINHHRNPKFSTYTHSEGDVYFPKSSSTYHFWQYVYLQLSRIRPARKELNVAEYV